MIKEQQNVDEKRMLQNFHTQNQSLMKFRRDFCEQNRKEFALKKRK
jgi:hypothetical protein